MMARTAFLTAMAGLCLAGAAGASEILVTSDISVSTHWTAGNTYNLQQQIYVLPGATLTIDAGTVIASGTNIGGSLAVCKGAQIFINGTATDPVIMTSKADVATWVGGNPKTGTWREAANEWGNLTLMGAAYISANNHGGTTTNTPVPSASNVAPMEGLVAGFPGDTKVLYGGGNDDDDSGSIHYLSLRYGGKVVGLNNELNGLSMGGIGRQTDVDHVDIMNNIDDGIETWGGTVNYKYLNVWNIGDDSFDADEGWRGKVQFGLFVIGYSINGSGSGSGVGDHGCEIDGAEDSDWQPVSTSTLYNLTVIGQPLQTRGFIDWRDNARIQYRNCIFMDAGGEVVKFDNLDGDGAHGYGFNGTLTWAQTWTTPFNNFSTVNAPANPAAFYPVQTSGMLAEMTDSVFFRNINANAYTEANNRGVFAAANNNVNAGSAATDQPIQQIQRGPLVVRGGVSELPVTLLDPRPANAAMTSVNAAPNDGFFTPAQYRGAFQPRAASWLGRWTASYAYGFTPITDSGTPFCVPGTAGVNACPCSNPGATGRGCDNSSATGGALLTSTGVSSLAADNVVFTCAGEKPTATSIVLQGTTNVAAGASFGQGIRCVGGSLKRLYTHNASGGVVSAPVGADPSVSARSAALGDTILPGSTRYYQTYYRDPTVLGGCPSTSTFNVSNGLSLYWDL